MSKIDRLHVAVGVLATVFFFIVAAWAQWWAKDSIGTPSDYGMVVFGFLKWGCLFAGLAGIRLLILFIPKRADIR